MKGRLFHGVVALGAGILDSGPICGSQTKPNPLTEHIITWKQLAYNYSLSLPVPFEEKNAFISILHK